MKSKIGVLLSGGVDSSVSALILKKRGFEVIGIHLKMVKCKDEGKTRERSCCSLTHEIDARKIAESLNIPFYVFNFEKEFERVVLKDFVEKYREGKTPNPCVICNAYLRFPLVIEKLKKLGIEKVASGHYVRKENSFILRGIDRKHDQSYFLYRLNKEILKSLIFPLGELRKDEVREMAKKESLSVYDKRSSQDFCFIDGNYRDYLSSIFPQIEGNIIYDGKVVGKHKGIYNFTVGQRKGLGSFGKPMYVIKIDARNNSVIIGEKKDALKEKIFVENINFLKKPERKNFKALVKIRYSHLGEEAEIELLEDKKAVVYFKNPVLSPTPGQSAVFYEGEYLVGGGEITK